MTPTARRLLFFTGALGVACLLVWGLLGLPAFGHYRGPYGDVVNSLAVPRVHATNAVAAVVFDFRGSDTLIEETIFFAAVTGTALLLRAQRQEKEEGAKDSAPEREAPTMSDAVRAAGLLMTAAALLFGLYIVAHGHLTPGGGFQGGVVVASATLTVYLASRYRVLLDVVHIPAVDVVEPLGAAGYALLGVIPLLFGTAFMTNFLPLGAPGDLLSAGTLPLLNLTVGLEIAMGIVLIVAELLEQTLAIRSNARSGTGDEPG